MIILYVDEDCSELVIVINSSYYLDRFILNFKVWSRSFDFMADPSNLLETGPVGFLRLFLIVYTTITSFIKYLFDSFLPKYVKIHTRTFRLRHILGTGAQSFVYLAQESNGHLFAIKQMRSDSLETLEDIKAEIASHKACSGCENVMNLEDATIEHLSTGKEIANLLFPLMTGGSLQDVIDISNSRNILPPFTENALYAIGLGISKGLLSLHETGRAHRDVCPRNVMLRISCAPVSSPVPIQSIQVQNVILTDLGSCAPIVIHISSRSDALRLEEEAQVRSSMPYRAPELWSCDPGMDIRGELTDVFALGCTLYACAFGYSCFESVKSEDGRLKIADPSHNRVLGSISFPQRHTFSNDFCNLILKCIEKEPQKRITVSQAASELARLGKNTLSLRTGRGIEQV